MKIRTWGVDFYTGKEGWIYTYSGESPKVGDTVGFTCNGRGRGGHYHVTARVAKVNQKTLRLVEALNSYSPGTEWSIHKDTESLYLYKD